MPYNWPTLELTVPEKVGIGTENPTQALDVNGTAKVTSLIVDNNLTVSGNLGLGTIDPTHKLYVNDNTGIRQNQLYLAGGLGWSSLSYNAYHNADNSDWVFPDPTRPAVTLEMDDLTRWQSTPDPRFEIFTTSSNAPTTWTRKFSVRSGGVEVDGNLKINGNLKLPNTDGGTAEFTNAKYSNEANFKKNNIKLSLGSSSSFVLGRPPLEYEFAVGHISSFFNFNQGGLIGIRTTFNKVFSVDQTGKAYFAAGKAGFVVDYFVNRVGDTLEQGDVVVLSNQPVSHYSGHENNIPIPEVDLTEKAYDTKICGIVSGFVTEQDLPYVEILTQDISEESQQTAVESTEPLDHPLKHLAATAQADLDPKKVLDQQMGTMVTLGAFAHCKVDADIAPIEVGDLLTTSPTKGHAQKVLEPARAIGAIIGKALAPLEKGKGKIPVLVTLQ